ncbi:unnamed protein product, partial [Symbiodinium microadriaticum]
MPPLAMLISRTPNFAAQSCYPCPAIEIDGEFYARYAPILADRPAKRRVFRGYRPFVTCLGTATESEISPQPAHAEAEQLQVPTFDLRIAFVQLSRLRVLGTGQVMGIETEPYMRWKIGNQVWQPDFRATGAESFNFVIYDPEQHLTVTLWDRDLLSQDDLMGEAQTVAAVKAVNLSDTDVPLICPGNHSEETRQAGTFKAKIELLITAPGHQSQEGFVCVVRVRELLQAGSKIKGRRLAVRAKFKDESSITKAGAPMLDITETLPAKEMLHKIKDNMTDAGVEMEKIDQVLDLTSLRSSRFAINRSLHFVIKNQDADTEEIILDLVDMAKLDEMKKEAKKKGVFGSTSPASNTNHIEETRGDEVLATFTVKLSDVRASK